MKSEWLKIAGLGTRGIEPDLLSADRPPESFDDAVNVRSVGSNLANAGGYVAIPNANIPDAVVPSNCSPCPQIFYGTTLQDGELVFDRSWGWDWSDTKHYLAVFEINKGGTDYSQRFVIREAECLEFKLERIEIEINNDTTRGRSIKLVKYDATGAPILTGCNYDASAIFGDGMQHFVIVEQFDDTGGQFGYNIWIDNVVACNNISFVQNNQSAMTSVIRENSAFGISLPVAFYRYSITLRDCLISGNFNGFGRCVKVEQLIPFRFDRTATDVDLELFYDERICTPKIGTSTRRNAYLKHGKITGKVYWEWVRDNRCKANDYIYGGVLRGLTLGTDAPGTVANSWGYAGPSGTFWADGVSSGIGYIGGQQDRTMLALDADTGDIWIGGGNTDLTPQWIGGGTPGVSSPSANIGNSKSDMQLTPSFFLPTEAIRILSSADSVRHAAPAGFGYLRQP